MNYSKEEILDDQHWTFEDYRQRMTTKKWRELLLNDDDMVIFQGKVTRLIGKSLGNGVIEVWKDMNNERNSRMPHRRQMENPGGKQPNNNSIVEEKSNTEECLKVAYEWILSQSKKEDETMKTIIIDGLEWQAKDDGNERNLRDSLKYANTLGDGWRLPTIKELVSIIDFTTYNPACTVESCRSSRYWSGSPYAHDSSYAWYVNFNNGNVDYCSNCFHRYVRCVRAVAGER